MNNHLSTIVRQVLKDAFATSDIEVDWRRPQGLEHGDLTTTVALQISKKVGKNPREIAEALVTSLQNDQQVERVEVAGAGYVNVWLTPDALLSGLNATREACTAKVKRKEPPIILDYSAPNIAKPLGIHHILSTVIGQSLNNLYTHQGYETVAVNHIGDWGTQFGKLAVAMEKWGTKPVEECTMDDLLSFYVRFHDEAEKDPTLEDEGRLAFQKLEAGDPALRSFWKTVVENTMKEVEGLYERLHVSFDYTQGESYYEDKMQPIIEEGKEKGVFVPGEKGALIVEFPGQEDLSPAVVLKGDDATIYLTRDLATARYRIDTWHPQSILYVVDVAQSYYFRQLFATLERLEWELPHMEHVVFGRMRFKDAKMSTRKGNILKLEEVLDEAVKRADQIIGEHGEHIQTDDRSGLAEMMGVGAVVYGVLSQNRKQDLVFDWDRMLSFDGNSAPYLQYTHARARSVLRKAEMESVEYPTGVDALADKERQLVQVLLQFESVLAEACSAHMPHILANYLFELCQVFNTFYNDLPILKSEGSERTLRLALTEYTADVLKAGAEILTLRVPDRM